MKTGWALVLLALSFLVFQTFTMGGRCQGGYRGAVDDVDLGWCYAVYMRDSGNVVAQVYDTFNYDMMRLTGQHHPWAPGVPRQPEGRWGIWIDGAPSETPYAHHLTEDECQRMLSGARAAFEQTRRDPAHWHGTIAALGVPGARCVMEK